MKNLQINSVLTVLLLAFMRNNTLAEEASSRNLIVGGSPVPRDKSYAWFVRFGGAKHVGDIPRFCGGALVSPEFVLTSARCLPLLDDGEEIMIGARCGGVAEEIGGDNCGQYYEMRSIQRTIVSKDFVNISPFFHDLVLVQLNEPSTIEPVVIDDGLFTSKYTEGKELWVIGFGAKGILQNKDKDEIFPYELEHAEVKYGNQEKCFQEWKKLNQNREDLDDSMMCVGSLESSACLFDTGGPLYDSENNVLVGIARWEDSQCAFKFGSIFNRLSLQFGKIKFRICQLSSSFPKPNMCDNNPPSTPSPTHSPIERPPSCVEGKVYVAFKLKTDKYGDNDNKATIVDTTSGEEIESIDDLQSNHEYFIEKCLPCALYNLTIYDAYGDGLLSPGGFFVSVDGETIASSWRGPGQEKNVVGHALSILFNGSKCSPSPSISPSDKPSTTSTPTFYTSHPSHEPSASPTKSILPSYSPSVLSCSNEELHIVLKILTDEYPGDNTVKIISLASGETSFEVKKFTEMKHLHTYKLCVTCGLYQLSIMDSYKDGITRPKGFYSLTVNGKIVVSEGSVEGHETTKHFGDSSCKSDRPSYNLSDPPSLSPSHAPTTKPTSYPTIYGSTSPSEAPTLINCLEGEIFVVVEIATDDYPQDTTVILTDMLKSEIVREFKDFKILERHFFSECMPCSLYQLSITDTYGDGIKKGGYYSLSVDRESIVLRGKVVGFGNTTMFGYDGCVSAKPSTSQSMQPSSAPSLEGSTLPSAYPTINGGLITLSVTFQQTFESSRPLGSSVDSFEKIMESYTQIFAGSDKGVQTSCSVQDVVFSDSFMLVLVVYEMTFESMYTDVSSYGLKFKEFMNSNLSRVADDLIAFDIGKALQVYVVKHSPTPSPTTEDNFRHSVLTETYYQEFDAASRLSNTGKIAFEERIEYYAHFFFKAPENQFMASCYIVDQIYIASQDQLNIKFTIKFHSSKDMSSYHDKFRDFINANLPRFTSDLSEFGVKGAKPAFLLDDTELPTTSPTSSCSEESIHVQLNVLTGEKAKAISVEVRSIVENNVIEEVTGFLNASQKTMDFCLPCARYFLSILVSLGKETETVFQLTVDDKLLVKDGVVYGFGTAAIIYSEKCSSE